MVRKARLHLFGGFGIELEYMIVDRETLSVLPVADRLLVGGGGEPFSEIEAGPLCWSNELALHLVELKTNGPVPNLSGVDESFSEGVQEINRRLAPLGAQLMPSAMHPWMDPCRETRLWPHDDSAIYQAYDRIFGCRGHGWANLQSVHLNLPFQGEEEFARLHAAVRLLLPILPALAASSPVIEGKPTGFLDSRLEVYRLNQKRIPSITGRVIPEPVFSREVYRRTILEQLYRDIAPHDPEGLLQHEWLNSRGAIARFERDTVEIRLIDIQECPRADLAVVALVTAALKALAAEAWLPLSGQMAWEVEQLEPVLLRTIREGEEAFLDDGRYLRAFGFPGDRCRAGELWRHLAAQTYTPESNEEGEALRVILERGPLARRLLRALGKDPSFKQIREVYRKLCICLDRGEMFLG
ncbi:MAG: glutamate-cysteine ligase family protein [Desulfuromonadales bacterium]|jgi:carboxylate-amine ligase